jgi:hypothetical protein
MYEIAVTLMGIAAFANLIVLAKGSKPIIKSNRRIVWLGN